MKWIAKDKFDKNSLLHCGGSFFLALFGTWQIASGFGVGWEARSVYAGNGASWRDLFADAVGIGLATWLRSIAL